jgi:hypothetical protein
MGDRVSGFREPWFGNHRTSLLSGSVNICARVYIVALKLNFSLCFQILTDINALSQILTFSCQRREGNVIKDGASWTVSLLE